jgi:hypothetical protein
MGSGRENDNASMAEDVISVTLQIIIISKADKNI